MSPTGGRSGPAAGGEDSVHGDAGPAGWRPDPSSPGRLRWWNGGTWADITRAESSPDSPTPRNPGPVVAWGVSLAVVTILPSLVVLGMGCDRLLGLSKEAFDSLVRLMALLEAAVIVGGPAVLWRRLRRPVLAVVLIGLLVWAVAVFFWSGIVYFVAGAACDCGRGNCL